MGGEFSRSFEKPKVWSERHMNPFNRLYANFPEPYDTPLKKWMHDMRHSRNEVLYIGYWGLQGAITGVIVGMGFINPLINHSPYAYRKFTMSLKPAEELIPIDTISKLGRAGVARYARLGFTAGVLFKFFSDFYDHVLSTNKVTKYLLLGTSYGAFAGFWFGGFKMHWPGAAAGLLVGVMMLSPMPAGLHRVSGNAPPEASEYMSHVTSEQQRLYKLQEGRLMGYTQPDED